MHWSRNIILTLLIVSTLSSSLLVPLIFLDFELRRDYIEKVLCIDRDKPITVCKGSCVLNNRLDFAREQEQKEQQNVKPIEITFYVEPLFSESVSLDFFTLEVPDFFYYQSTYEPHLLAVFHPPSV